MAHQNSYDFSGDQYDFTRAADPYLTNKIFELLQPHSNGMHLDIGCGTGNYTMALAAKGLNFTGVDPSEKMLDLARAKAPHIQWRVGSAENIPADNDTFDNIIATLTLHHWNDLNAGFAELHRVLKNHGKIVIYTSCPSQMQHYWLNHYFPKMMAHSIERMPSLDQVRAALSRAQFNVTHRAIPRHARAARPRSIRRERAARAVFQRAISKRHFVVQLIGQPSRN